MVLILIDIMIIIIIIIKNYYKNVFAYKYMLMIQHFPFTERSSCSADTNTLNSTWLDYVLIKMASNSRPNLCSR